MVIISPEVHTYLDRRSVVETSVESLPSVRASAVVRPV